MASSLTRSHVAAAILLLLSGAVAANTPVEGPVKATLGTPSENGWQVCGPSGCSPVDEICGTWGCAQTKHICPSSGCDPDGRDRQSNNTMTNEQTFGETGQMPFKIMNVATPVAVPPPGGTPVKGPYCSNRQCKIVAVTDEGSGEVRLDVCNQSSCVPIFDILVDTEGEGNLENPITGERKPEL